MEESHCGPCVYLLQDLNDKKRLATSGANTARAYTVLFGTCKAPENFTGCEDLAKKKVCPIFFCANTPMNVKSC